jgi:hypothetical protein
MWYLKAMDKENLLIRGNAVAAHPAIPCDMKLDIVVEMMDFFENAPIALHWLSGTGHVLWANKYELESLGYQPEEYIGHSILEVHDNFK